MNAKRKATDSPGTPSKCARKVLTIAEKINVIDAVETGKSHRCVANDFNVGRTQINQIISNKDSIKSMYSDGMNASFKYLAQCNMLYPEIDKDVWEFFSIACSKLIPVNGPMLQSEANESALRHNYDKFTASNGWLKSFFARHQINFSTLHGEGAQVSHEAVDQWLAELPNITNGYDLRYIYNCDETSIFFKALPATEIFTEFLNSLNNKMK